LDWLLIKRTIRSALAAPEIARFGHLHYSLGNVFGKSTIHTNTLGAKVLTEQRLPSLTVMTQGQSLISTSVANIGSGVISDLKTLDVLSDGLDDTDSFVTGDKGELGHELSLVDVLVGSTDSAEDDYGYRVNEGISASDWIGQGKYRRG